MKPTLFFFSIVLASIAACSQAPEPLQPSPYADKIDSVMAKMTLEEKIGQMNQLSGNGKVTGPVTLAGNYQEAIRKGHVGSMLNVISASYTRKIQKIAVEESRLGIPLVFGYDIIHGYKTIFPLPLGESASWDLEAIEKSARIAAVEAAAAGQHWTFAPMIDIARDARWGRGMEGAGEDPYLTSEITRARVRGFQGDDLSLPNTILACAKHYVAYGAGRAGREYNTVDISKRTLYEVHLPPFKAAVDEGVATIMTSFNEYNGVPTSGSKKLIKGILREDWGWEGLILSDWASISQMTDQGCTKGNKEAAHYAIDATVDMDMEGHAYIDFMKALVDEGKVSEPQIDAAVRRILHAKFELGLFDDPYRYSDETRNAEVILSDAHRGAARDMARKSMVLLKNEDNTLPFSKEVKTVAVIGPLGKSQKDMIGTWQAQGEAKHAVSLVQGLENLLPDAKILYAQGCDIESEDKSGFNKALRTARKADIVIAAVGESAMMSGEAHSRLNIDIPGVQQELVLELAKLNKPMAVALFNGRPLVLTELHENKAVPAILETWLAGTEAGNAIAEVLFGDYNPSGKLPVTFPYHLGQTPIFYAHKHTGRPKSEDRYTSKYIDGPNTPLYPFGHGLSYTSFEIGEPQLSNESLTDGEILEVSVTIKNTGDRKGKETVQLYTCDLVASVTRPVKQLQAFRQIELEAGQEETVKFSLSHGDFAFYNRDWQYVTEPGTIEVYAGANSQEVKTAKFELK